MVHRHQHISVDLCIVFLHWKLAGKLVVREEALGSVPVQWLVDSVFEVHVSTAMGTYLPPVGGGGQQSQ